MSRRRVLLVCDLDSQVFGALPLARAFLAAGWRAGFAIDSGGGVPRDLADRLAAEFDLVERPAGEVAVDPEARGNDAVGVFLTGSRLALFRHASALAARALGGPRPALFCGFNGLVFEKFEEGVGWRLGYDVVCLNGPRDAELFAGFVAGSRFASQPAVVTGLRRHGGAAPAPTPEPGRRKLFVFAEQVIVPAELHERRALVGMLARLAARSPGWDVVIKARVRPEERTFHDQTAHVARLVEKIPDRPANLLVAYEPLEALLGRAELFATISSTALFDALERDVPSLVAADFGVRNAHGTHVFLGSGLMTELGALASLDAAPRRAPDGAWLERVGYSAASTPKALIDWLQTFDPASEPPAALVSFEAAARGAAPSKPLAQAILAARDEVEARLAAGDRPGAASALPRLGAAMAAADRERALNAAWRAREGAAAAFARRLGVYWAYKRARVALLGAPGR